MKSWQANTVTICVAIIALLRLWDFIEIRWAMSVSMEKMKNLDAEMGR